MTAPAASERAAPVDVLRLVSSGPAALLIVFVAVVQQSLAHANADNSWLITVADQVSRGAIAYADIQESNPPLAFLVYMPAVLLSRLVGFRPEAWTVVEILALLALVMALSARILRAGGALTDEEAPLWRNAALFVFLIAPQFGFAEREHFAALFCLPVVAAAVVRASGGGVGVGAAIAAGLCSSLAVGLKPYFAVGIVTAAVALVAMRRSPRLLFAPEFLVGAAGYLVYLGLVALYFPRFYSDMMPLGFEVYAPARLGLAAMLAMPSFLGHALLLAALVYTGQKIGFGARAPVLMAVAAGFLLIFVYQGKGWFNHAYPATVFAMFAALALWRDRIETDGAAAFARYCVVPVFVCAPVFAAPVMALPGAEECRANATPTPDSAFRRWTPATWSTKTSLLPSSSDRSTVSPHSRASSCSAGRANSAISKRAAAASGSRPGPSRTPRVGEAAITSCSWSSASTMRWMVDRGNASRRANSPSVSPAG